MTSLVTILLLMVALFAPSAAVTASAPLNVVEVLSTEFEHTFGESLRFSLQASAESPIAQVILFYGQKGEGLVRRIYPPFMPDTRIDVTYTEELEPGQFAPGVELVAWWEVHTTAGDVIETPQEELRYVDHYHDWQVLAGETVDYHWHGQDRSRAQELLAVAEDVIARLSDEVGIEIDRRVQIYAYNSQTDMSRALSSRSETYDDRVLTLGVSVGHNTLLLLATHPDVEMTMAHELSHVVVGVMTDNPFSDLPRWLDEGLAMYSEGDLPPGNRRALERAVAEDELLSVRSMSSYSGQASEVDLYYGEAYSIVDFMLEEYGRGKMQELLAVFSKGARQEDALHQVYGFGLQELDRRWRASLGLGPRPLPDGDDESLSEDAPPAATVEPAERGEDGFSCTYAGGLILPLLGLTIALRRRTAGTSVDA